MLESQLKFKDIKNLELEKIKEVVKIIDIPPHLRPNLWMFLLNFLPKNKFKIENFIEKRHKVYKMYFYKETRKMVLDYKYPSIPHKKTLNDDFGLLKNLCVISCDIDRVFLKIDLETNKCLILDEEIENYVIDDFTSTEKRITHRKILRRILLTYKSINPEMEYMQGMHSLLLPIYYTITEKATNSNIKTEAITFFCFVNLIADLQNQFSPKMDNEKTGTYSLLKEIYIILKKFDKETHTFYKNMDILEYNLHLKWLYCIFAGDFEIDEVCWLWDKIFASKNIVKTTQIFCSAVFIICRNKCNGLSTEEIILILQDFKSYCLPNDIYEMYKKISQKLKI